MSTTGTNKSNNLGKEGKFVRYMKAPVKVLARARDFYVHSLNGCSGQVAYYGSAVGCPPPYNPAGLPRSFSTNSSYNPNQSSRDEDMRELVRIASARSLVGGTEAEILRPAEVSRSRTVAIGRIDEDKPCEFLDAGEMKPLHNYHRSKSYAAASGRSRGV